MLRIQRHSLHRTVFSKGLGFMEWGLGFRGLGFRVFGFRVVLGFRVYGLGFRV